MRADAARPGRHSEGVIVKVSVDPNLCVGHGRCYVLAPDVFTTDDFGHCEVLVESLEGPLADQARIGAENCPERAITVED